MLALKYQNVDISVVGEANGLCVEEAFASYANQIAQIVDGLYQRKDIPGQGLQWLNLPYNEETIWYVKEFASQIKGKFENILVLGIGGSALGGIALTQALLKPFWNLLSSDSREDYPRIFFLDNIDPDEMNALFSILDWNKTLVNVITKSGDTAEPMSQFMVVREILRQKLGVEYRNHIVATTDKKMGILRQIAEQEGYKTFFVPDDVGGRFSVFSAVGLLLFALVGIDIDLMVQGLKDMDSLLQNPDIFQNVAAQNALIHYLLDTQKGKTISVLMPYSSRLKYVPDWFAQLWAESLGKNKVDAQGVQMMGSTPLKALGVTDQHSQMQLFNEGPNNKLINFIRVKEYENSLDIPQIYQYTGIGYLGGKTINQLINAEADATNVALSDYSRPSVTIWIDKIDAYHLAQLFYLFEVQTAIAGELYGVNTFDQPGVEQSKNYIYALMGRAGYEDSANVLREKTALVCLS